MAKPFSAAKSRVDSLALHVGRHLSRLPLHYVIMYHIILEIVIILLYLYGYKETKFSLPLGDGPSRRRGFGPPIPVAGRP